MAEKTKVVIEIEGGNVSSVYSSDPDLDVTVLDWDTVKTKDYDDEAAYDAAIAAAEQQQTQAEAMHEVY